MTKTQSVSRRRNRDLIAKFAARAIKKNDDGVKRYGGGLSEKDTTGEIANEILDLMNYWVEHEEQVARLVTAAEEISKHAAYRQGLSKGEKLKEPGESIVRDLRAALAPFLSRN